MWVPEIGILLDAGAAGPVSRQDPRAVGAAFESMFLQKFLSAMNEGARAMGAEKSSMSKMQEDWAWNLLAQTVAGKLAETDGLGLNQQLQAYFSSEKKP
jgi:Rod binding domain-containing protein